MKKNGLYLAKKKKKRYGLYQKKKT